MFGNSSFGGTTSFGSTTFGSGFGATPSLGAFGSTPQTNPQPAGPIGTTIRFVPLQGSDSVPRAGNNAGGQSIQTRHQNISAMKEYESKSVDELRLEDYAANRKVGQPTTGFQTAPFASMQPSTSQQPQGLFGQNTSQTTSNLFNSPFNQPKTGFEMNSGSNIFNTNKPNTTVTNSPFSLGAQPNTTSTASGQSNFSIFNTNNNQPATATFGSSNVNSAFKTNMFTTPVSNTTGSIFNTNPSTSTSSFLGQPTATNQQQTPFGGNTSLFAPTNPTTSSLFSNATPNQTQNLFGTKPDFGLNNTSNVFNSSANKPATTISNSPFTIGTSFNTNTTTTQNQPGFPLFNTNNNQPSPFNTGESPFKQNIFGSSASNNSLFNPNPSTSGFLSNNPSTSTNQPNTNFTSGSSLFAPVSSSNTNLFSNPAQSATSNIFSAKPNFDINGTSNIFNSVTNKPNTAVASSPFTIGTPSTSTVTAPGNTFSPFNNQTNATPFGNLTTNNPFKANPFSAPSTSTTSLFNMNNSNQTTNFMNPNPNNTMNQQQPNFGQNNSLFNQQNNVQQPTQLTPDNLLNRFKVCPYGESSLFLNDTADSGSSLGPLKFTTDPKTINHFKINAKTNVKLNKPPSSEKSGSNSVLFDGLDDNTDDNLKCAIDVFLPKKSVKKLDLKPSSHLSEGDAEHSTDSPLFERTRSGANSRSFRENTLDSGSASNSRHIRFAEDTFPASDANGSYVSNLSPMTNSRSDLSSLQNSSLNRSSLTPQSPLNSHAPNRSFANPKSGIINTRPEYRIKPSLDEIERRYNSENDSCYVDSFLIERPNYGSILFESPLDVKGLNLDEIVHIRRKEVVVYPDDENKPPVGQGINRSAIITLHQVWPVDKSNNQVIKDVERLTAMRYPEKIESATVEKGARFIEYRPETGSWVFSVKHFSKYGITDDDEEPCQIVAPNNPSLNQPQGPLPLGNQSTNNIQQQPQPGQETGVVLNRIKLGYNDTSLFLNNSRQLVRQSSSPVASTPKSDSKSNSCFKMSAKTNITLNKPSTPDRSKTNSSLFENFDDGPLNRSIRNAIEEFFDSEKDTDLTKSDTKRSHAVNGTKRLALQDASFNMSSSSYEKRIFNQPVIHGASVPKQQKVRDLKLQPDLTSARNKLIRDINSVCAAGAPKVRFFNGSRKFCRIQGDSVIIHELKLVPSANQKSLTEQLITRFESFLDKNSTVTSPNVRSALAPYIETLDYISDATSYEVLHALHGSLVSKTPYAKQDERLNRVITWLASVNRNLVPPKNLYQLIIYHMSCDRYDLAANLAIENNHPRLALLLATLNLNKDLMYEQLSSWRLSLADQYIDPELLRIYVLLSGFSEWKLSNDVTIYCLKGLEWTQQLCLLALHVTSNEPEKYGFHMLPLHIKRLDTKTNDVEHHILARHSPARTLSAAKSLIEEWFLLESLKSFHVINSESECMNSDIIHCNLASQLGPIDLRWACFVALHIINNQVRNQILVKCLEQNHEQLKDERQDLSKPGLMMTVESWLIEKLRIPVEFIQNSKILAEKEH